MLSVITNIYAFMIYESICLSDMDDAIDKITSKCHYFGFKATIACQAFNVGHDDLNVIEQYFINYKTLQKYDTDINYDTYL